MPLNNRYESSKYSKNCDKKLIKNLTKNLSKLNYTKVMKKANNKINQIEKDRLNIIRQNKLCEMKIQKLEKQRVELWKMQAKVRDQVQELKTILRNGDIDKLDKFGENFNLNYDDFWAFRATCQVLDNSDSVGYFIKKYNIPNHIIEDTIVKCIRKKKFNSVGYITNYLAYLDKIDIAEKNGISNTNAKNDIVAPKDTNQATCPISLEIFKDIDVMICCKGCKNLFSIKYMVKWLNDPSNTCPLCRTGRDFCIWKRG